MRDLIRRLIKWAAPELFRDSVKYLALDGDRVVHRGELVVGGYREIPWQLTLPCSGVDDFCRPPLPWELETYYRHRGSTDPVLYFKLTHPGNFRR